MLNRFFATLIAWPFILRYRLRPEHRLFKRLAETLSLIPGRIGLQTRARFYARTLAACGDNAEFGFGTVLNYPDIHIGRDVSFGRHCTVGLADFGDYALVAGYCQFLSGANTHAFADPATPIRQQKATLSRIRVGRDVWVGAGAIVMASVGDGSIVGAGTVVTRPVGERLVVAGNPARRLRSRDDAPGDLTTPRRP